MYAGGHSTFLLLAALLLLGLLAACAKVPDQSYGVRRLQFEGVKALDEGALRACLATEEREALTLGLSALREPTCGSPPFDRARASLRLFAWPWTDWPVYDEAVFRLDLDRIDRWYEARGYYGARVLDVRYDPAEAAQSDVPSAGAKRTVSIEVLVEEGVPVRIRKLALRGTEKLDASLRKKLTRALALKPGEIFDEAVYDRARSRLTRALTNEGYARAEIHGDVLLDEARRNADITLTVEPGPICYMGDVRVTSAGSAPHAPILAAAKLERGALYRESDLDDAQRSIYALGAFSAVTVRGDFDKPGDHIDIAIDVQTRRESELMFGAGMMSGVLSTSPQAAEWVSVPQWDIHLTGTYEHRNFRGGLRRLRIEERPRLLFLDTFPGIPADSPRIGNAFRVLFSQPGALEPRTTAFADARWDTGPDPFLLFFRHDIGAAVGLERGFFRQRLFIHLAVHQEVMLVSKRQPLVDDPPSSYRLFFLEQRVSLDLRDDSINTTSGAYFAISVHEALRIWNPSWTYLRLTPEVRVYVPLGLGLVLAARFAIGWTGIFSASPRLDAESQVLGPQLYRLRGGGAQSNRGFPPGDLGDGRQGGIRRWESSLELRVPLTKSLTAALFTDMGNVSATDSFGFYRLNTAVGGGLRYRTLIGPIRFDVGVRPRALQSTNGSPPDPQQTRFLFTHFEGAVHLTIGEAF